MDDDWPGDTPGTLFVVGRLGASTWEGEQDHHNNNNNVVINFFCSSGDLQTEREDLPRRLYIVTRRGRVTRQVMIISCT